MTHFYYCKNWKDTNNNKPVRINAYNPAINTNDKKELAENAKQLVWIQYDENNMDYYSLPTYYSAITDIKTLVELSKWNLNSVKGGFSPNLAVTMVGKKDTPEGRRRLMDNLIFNYVGSMKTKVLTFFADNKDVAPIVTNLGTNVMDGTVIAAADYLLP